MRMRAAPDKKKPNTREEVETSSIQNLNWIENYSTYAESEALKSFRLLISHQVFSLLSLKTIYKCLFSYFLHL